jgi:choline dehydrogenase
VVADLPGVGENLQDHLEVYVQHACKQPVSVAPALRWWNQPAIGLEWLLKKTGAAATNHFEAGAFLRSDPDQPYPNVQLHFLPLAVRYDGSSPVTDHGYQVHAGPNLSNCRGSVRIQSTDATVHPKLVFNYLSTEEDRGEWVNVLRRVREILSQPAFADFDGGEISPGPAVQTDAEILDWVARDAETALHPCGTCKMGTDPMAVVHPETFEVHGVEGLAVVDASVMPSLTNGNIYAPIMMIAEKAADLLQGHMPLEPVAHPAPTEPNNR